MIDEMDANVFMVKKLKALVDDGTIENEYDEKFINNIHSRLTHGMPINEKQEAYLETCFHDKY